MVLRDAAGELLTFISGSKGGRNAIAKLMGKVAKSAQAREGKCPVVALESDTYDHVSYGSVHIPVFRIVDWEFWNREDAATAPPPSKFETELNDEVPF